MSEVINNGTINIITIHIHGKALQLPLELVEGVLKIPEKEMRLHRQGVSLMKWEDTIDGIIAKLMLWDFFQLNMKKGSLSEAIFVGLSAANITSKLLEEHMEKHFPEIFYTFEIVMGKHIYDGVDLFYHRLNNMLRKDSKRRICSECPIHEEAFLRHFFKHSEVRKMVRQMNAVLPENRADVYEELSSTVNGLYVELKHKKPMVA